MAFGLLLLMIYNTTLQYETMAFGLLLLIIYNTTLQFGTMAFGKVKYKIPGSRISTVCPR